MQELQQPEISFWTAWENDELAGRGALKELNKPHVEIKSIRTSVPFLRRGVAAKLPQHILSEVKQRGCEQVSLETGSQPAFEPTRQLYLRFGFVECKPFADYRIDPNSIYMTLQL